MAVSGIGTPWCTTTAKRETLARVVRVVGWSTEESGREEESSRGLLRVKQGASKLHIFCGEGGQYGRQFHAENSATFLTVVTENLSAMFLDNAEANAQAQTCALADRLRRIERIEDPVRLPDAGAGVREQDYDVAAVAKGLDGQNAALLRFHGIQGVADDVEKNLHQLISVAAHAGKNRFELQLDLCRPRTQVQRTELHGIVHDGVDIEERSLGGHLARESQEISDQGFCAARLVANFCRGRAGLFRNRGIISEQIGKSQDRRKRIIDFVCRAGGKLAERNKLFGLHDLRLQPFQIIDGLFRSREKLPAVLVSQVGTQEDQKRQGKGGHERGHQPEIAHLGRLVAKPQRVDGEQWQ